MTAPVVVDGKGYVPEAEHQELMHQLSKATRLLNAIVRFSPLHLAALIEYMDDEILNVIDDRLGHLEYRLDNAGIKNPPEGVPDDVSADYFTLPLLQNFEAKQ